MNEPLIVSAVIPGDRDSVWAAWTNSELLKRWLSEDANVIPEAGMPFELFWDKSNRYVNSTIGCKILEMVPGRYLHIEWKGPAHFAELMNKEPLITKVKIHFDSLNAETKVTIEHYGWGEGGEWLKARAWHEMAWKMGLSRLKALFEESNRAV